MESTEKLSCTNCGKQVFKKKFDKHMKKCNHQERSEIDLHIQDPIDEVLAGNHDFKVRCEFCNNTILKTEMKNHRGNCNAVNGYVASETNDLVKCSLCLKSLRLKKFEKHKKHCKGTNQEKIFSSTLISNENNHKFPTVDKFEDESHISLKDNENNFPQTLEIPQIVQIICGHCGEGYTDKKFKKHAKKCSGYQEDSKLNISKDGPVLKKVINSMDETPEENLLENKKKDSASALETKTSCFLCGSDILERKFAKHLKKCKERNQEVLDNENVEKLESEKTKLKCSKCNKEVPEKKFQKHSIKCMTESNTSENDQLNKEETLYNGNITLNSGPDKIKLKCNNCGKEVSEKKFQKHLNKCLPEMNTNVEENPICEGKIKVQCEKCFKQVSEKKIPKHQKKCFSEIHDTNGTAGENDEKCDINKETSLSKCKYCKKDMKKNSLFRHYKICPKLPDKCEFCEEEMPKSLLHKHKQSCVRNDNKLDESKAGDNQLDSKLKRNKKQVNCNRCGKKMLKISLRRHEKRCNFSNTTLDNFLNLKTICKNCGEEMDKQNLSEHSKTCLKMEKLKSGKPKINCKQCGKEMLKASLSKHLKLCGKMKRKLEEDEEVCKKRLKRSESNLENDHIPEQPAEPEKIECEVCFLKVKRSKIHEHKEICQSKIDKSFTCSVEECTKSFKTDIDLNTHMYRVHRTYIQCPIQDCNEFSSSISILKKHLKSIHNERARVVCDYCKSKKLELILPHHIDYCPQNNEKSICKSTNCQEILLNPLEKKHKLCHLHGTGECRYCHEVMEVENLKRHKKKCKLLEVKEKEESDKEICNKECYTCTLENCKSSFVSEKSLKRHQYRVHQPPVKCPYEDCGRMVKPYNLKVHIYSMHEKIKVACPYCEKQYTKFSIRHHKKVCGKNLENAPML